MRVLPQSSNVHTFGELVKYGAQITYGFDSIEANINSLPAPSVLQCFDHHSYYRSTTNVFWPAVSGPVIYTPVPAGTTVKLGPGDGTVPMVGDEPTSLDEELLDDCLLAQYATNGIMFAFFGTWGQLLHLYKDKMFVSRKEDGTLKLTGMKDPANLGSIEEVQLTDPLVKYIFTALDQRKHILPAVSNAPGTFQRSTHDLGGDYTLQTSTTQINQGSVLRGFVMGLSIRNLGDVRPK